MYTIRFGLLVSMHPRVSNVCKDLQKESYRFTLYGPLPCILRPLIVYNLNDGNGRVARVGLPAGIGVEPSHRYDQSVAALGSRNWLGHARRAVRELMRYGMAPKYASELADARDNVYA
jgi:hypothetical protein